MWLVKGTARCVVASRLKELEPSASVALLERGMDDREYPLVMSSLAAPKLNEVGIRIDQNSIPETHLDGRRITNAVVSGLSRSSLATYGSWSRAHASDCDLWAQTVGDSPWIYQNMPTFFKKVGRFHIADANPEYHGFNGPIHTMQGPDYPSNQNVHDAYDGKAIQVTYWMPLPAIRAVSPNSQRIGG